MAREIQLVVFLYHMACIEEVYRVSTFDDRDPTKEELKRLNVLFEDKLNHRGQIRLIRVNKDNLQIKKRVFRDFSGHTLFDLNKLK